MGYGNFGGCGYGGRRYLTRDERVEWLAEYQKELENELKGVKERLKELKDDK